MEGEWLSSAVVGEKLIAAWLARNPIVERCFPGFVPVANEVHAGAVMGGIVLVKEAWVPSASTVERWANSPHLPMVLSNRTLPHQAQ